MMRTKSICCRLFTPCLACHSHYRSFQLSAGFSCVFSFHGCVNKILAPLFVFFVRRRAVRSSCAERSVQEKPLNSPHDLCAMKSTQQRFSSTSIHIGSFLFRHLPSSSLFFDNILAACHLEVVQECGSMCDTNHRKKNKTNKKKRFPKRRRRTKILSARTHLISLLLGFELIAV